MDAMEMFSVCVLGLLLMSSESVLAEANYTLVLYSNGTNATLEAVNGSLSTAFNSSASISNSTHSTTTSSNTSHTITTTLNTSTSLGLFADRDFEPSNNSPSSEEAPTPSWTCLDNRRDYTVSIDLQLKFESNQVASCTIEEETTMANTISNILNEAFPTKVPRWKGDAFFGSFRLDDQQHVNVAKRRLRGEAIRLLQAAAADSANTKCPQRDIDCEGDVCLWGCLPVQTSDCGVSSLVNWVNLLDDLKQSISWLGYGCLGNAMEMEVNLVIDEGPGRSGISNSQSSLWP